MTVDILVGTTKGTFRLRGTALRDAWDITGPFCDGWPINHVIGDPETGQLWAGGGNEMMGAGIWCSQDDGATWTLSKLAKGEMDHWMEADPESAALFGYSPVDTAYDGKVTAIWSLHRAHGRLFAGGKPGMLFHSGDDGATWDIVESLSEHPDKDTWNPGAAGLVVHTLISDPDTPGTLWAGISAAGVFATEDGGVAWERRNRLSNATACDGHAHPAAPRDGQTGFCVHNIVRSDGDLLYQQNHHGVYRSPDGGRHWEDITQGLPSPFGFPIAVDPQDSRRIWTVPLNGDTQGRYPPDARAAVWRSEDAGESWQAMRAGLPASDCYFTVLRQAMATDRDPVTGVYFGTNTGSIFGSRDRGATWDEIARHLPTVLSVETLSRG